MPKKRKVGRPTTGRDLEGRSALVRFNQSEYALIEKAIAHQTAAVVGGMSVTVASFADMFGRCLGGHPKPAIDGHLKTGHHA